MIAENENKGGRGPKDRSPSEFGGDSRRIQLPSDRVVGGRTEKPFLSVESEFRPRTRLGGLRRVGRTIRPLVQ